MKIVVTLYLCALFAVSCRSNAPTTNELIALCDIARHADSGGKADRAGAIFDEFAKVAPKASTEELKRALASAEPKDKYELVMKWAHRGNAYFECAELKSLWQ
jgi:hypothetical protein